MFTLENPDASHATTQPHTPAQPTHPHTQNNTRTTNKNTPTIIAVIPAYNEERFIASVVFQTKQHATHTIVIDDGSTDHTAYLAQQAGATVIRQPHNQGKAQALNTGFKHALTLNPTVIVCLDADAQHNPADIPTVIKPILNQTADVVIGSRFLSTKNNIPKWRQAGQHSLTIVTNTLSGTKTTDSQSGFRAFSPQAAQILNFKTTGLSVESEMQFLFQPANLRVAEAPITVKYQDGNKRNPIIHGLQVLDAMLSLIARRRPLAYFSLPGALIATIGLLIGTRVILTMQNTGQLMTGMTVLTALLIIAGILLGVTGIMLHSISTFANRIEENFKDELKHLNEKTLTP